MKQVKDREEMDGKTIKRNEYLDNRIFLFFTDDTFAVIRGCGWDGENDVEVCDTDYSLHPDDHDILELLRIGVLSDSEYRRLSLTRKQEQKEQERQNELKKLAELKEKYPDAK